MGSSLSPACIHWQLELLILPSRHKWYWFKKKKQERMITAAAARLEDSAPQQLHKQQSRGGWKGVISSAAGGRGRNWGQTGLFSMPLHKHICLLSLIAFASTSDALWVIWGSMLLPKAAFGNITFKNLEVTWGQKSMVDYGNSEKMPLVLFLLTLMGEAMLVSAPWLIPDDDWKTSRGPFKPELWHHPRMLWLRGHIKPEFWHDPMILWLAVCLFQSWVCGQCFTTSNGNASKHLQNLFEIRSGISHFLISDGCCSILERFPGYRPVKKMSGTILAASYLVKGPVLVIERPAWSGSSAQLERDWSVLLFGSLYLPAHPVKCRHYLRSWGRHFFGNQR